MKPLVFALLTLLAGCAPAPIKWNYSVIPRDQRPIFDSLVDKCVKEGGERTKCEHDLLYHSYPDCVYIYDQDAHTYKSLFPK